MRTLCHSSVLSIFGVLCVSLLHTIPYGLYLHLSPKDTIHYQKGENPGVFLMSFEMSHEKRGAYKTPSIVSVSTST